MKISVLIGTRNRPAVLQRCLESVVKQAYDDLEVIVLDDASEPPVAIEPLQKIAGDIPLKSIRADKQLGLNAVRNQLVAAASGDILFVIDDDAYFENDQALQYIVQAFNTEPKVGIIATKILDYRSGTVQPLTPHSRQAIRRDASILDDAHRISYFLGGAHAIRREVFESCGTYDEVLMYGLDEIEFAYRAINSGFQIHYLPSVIVHHEPPQPANPNNAGSSWRLFYLTRNRILFAYKHLPFPYALTYVPSWLGWYGYRALATGSLPAYLKGINSGIKSLKLLNRQPINSDTVTYLKANYGRLWR